MYFRESAYGINTEILQPLCIAKIESSASSSIPSAPSWRPSSWARGSECTAGHARALVGLSHNVQDELADAINNGGLSVRQTEALIAARKKAEQPKRVKPIAGTTTGFEDIEATLRESFGTRVAVMGSAEQGKVQIDYFSRDMLEGILEKLLNA